MGLGKTFVLSFPVSYGLIWAVQLFSEYSRGVLPMDFDTYCGALCFLVAVLCLPALARQADGGGGLISGGRLKLCAITAISAIAMAVSLWLGFFCFLHAWMNASISSAQILQPCVFAFTVAVGLIARSNRARRASNNERK